MNRTRKSLILSALALVVSISMLIGTTFAWFTDSVTSGGNIIKSGELDIKMYWTDDLASDNWYDVEDPAHKVIFEYDKWEPGYTQVRYIKIVNDGNLALNYDLAFHPESEVGKLAEVINVYCAEKEATLNSAADLSSLNSVGLLETVLENDAVVSGTLLANGQTGAFKKSGETVYTLAMNMITTAGNEYQNETAGSFSITALASQCSFEEDSFDSSYDLYAEMPKVLRPGRASAKITVADGKTTAPVTMVGDDVSATVPAGVAVKPGVDKLTLKVTPLKSSTAGITTVEDEVLIPVDVHIEGIADSNTTPIIIEIEEKMPKNLNLGNYKLIHVENGVNKFMTYVEPTEELTAHNQFKYDPLTGKMTVAMASFSEVAIVADTENAWKGEMAEGFAGGDGSVDNPYIIANADQLVYMNDRVSNANENYGGKNYKLVANLNIGGIDAKDAEGNEIDFYPIGYMNQGDEPNVANEEKWYTYGGAFTGTFDGMGHIVSGIYQQTWDMDGDYDHGYWNDAMGLFGYVVGAKIKYLTIDNFYSEGEFAPTGCVAAMAAGKCTFENITITHSHPQTYNTGVAGIVGWDEGAESKYTFKNITIDRTNTISALWGSWDVAAAGIMGYLGENSKADLINCHVAANIDVFNDVCGNYQYYWYRYCGMYIGTVDRRQNGGKGALDLSNITATNCTTNFGDTHEYYYCEFEKNTQASYTEDYQFSRVSHSDLNFTDSNENGIVDEDEKDSVTGCKHNHTENEDKRAVYIPFRQLFGGYGWGVDGVDIGNYDGIDSSYTKDELKFTHAPGFVQNPADKEEVNLSDMFAELSNASIVDSAVYVTIDKINESDEVSAKFESASEWENGKITFRGKGSLALTIQDYNKCVPYTVYVYVGGIDDGSGNDGSGDEA